MQSKIRVLTLLLTISFLATSYFFLCNAQVPPTESDWTLTITGLVEHPLNLTLAELAALPSTTEHATIYCVDFPTTVVTTGNWTGVKLSYLLQLAGANSTAKVAFYASDGYSTDLQMQLATQDNVLVAYQLNGASLQETLRLVVPGRWGYKWISQLTNINLVDYDYLGVWESRGYSDTATAVLPSGVADSPGLPNQYNPSYTQQPQASVSPSPLAVPPTPSPTPTPVSTPSSSTITTPVPTANPTATLPSITSPSPVSIEQSEPDSSGVKPSETSLLPYVAILGLFATVVFAVAVSVTRRRK